MKLKDIATYLGGTIVGDETTDISRIRGIDDADEGDLTFLANPRYRSRLATTRASAILVAPGTEEPGQTLLVVDDPYVALARALMLLYPETHEKVGVSEAASIHPTAVIGDGTSVYPGVCIGRGAKIGQGVVLYPGVYVGDESTVGDGSVLYARVTVYRRCRVGKRVVLHSGVVVGSDGFGFAKPGRENIKVPQVGYVQIDDDCEIGANTTIDRGALGATWIQRGVKIDNLVQIGHNVVIGEKSIIVALVGISGSTTLGKGVIVGGQAGIAGHLTIGDHVMIAAQSGVHKDIPAGDIVAGSPQMSHREWLRTQASLPQVPKLRKEMAALKARMTQLEEKQINSRKGSRE